MLNNVIWGLALCVILQGCIASKRVEGGKLVLSPSETIAIDASFKYVGHMATSYTNRNIDSIKTSTHTEHWEVFVKTYHNTNEITEIICGYWDVLPGRTVFKDGGLKPDEYFTSSLSRYKALASFLREQGFTFSSDFHVGLFNRVAEGGTYRFIAYGVAKTVTPRDVDHKQHLREKYASYTTFSR